MIASSENSQPVDRESPADTPEEEVPPLEGDRLKSCLEAVLFAAPEPVSTKRLRRILREAEPGAIDDALLALEADLLISGRGITLEKEASGYRLLTKPEYAPHVARLRGERRRVRLSQAAFETLAFIAYRQPVRRADLDSVRGVQSSAILKNLMEWNLIKILGREESLGRPLLYGTTETFLEQFGLSGLPDLPELEKLLELGGERGVEVVEEDPMEGVESTELAPEGEEPPES